MGVLTQLNYRAMRCSHSQVQAVRKELKDKSYKIHVCVIVNNGLTFVFAFILLNVNVYFLTEYTFGFWLYFSFHCSQELYQFYQTSHGSKQLHFRLSAYENNEAVPSNLSNYIKQLLTKRPITGHHLICALVHRKRTTDIHVCEVLQGLYVQCIDSLLDRLGSAEEEDVICRQVLHLLSFYNPDAFWNYLQMRQMFARLISLSKMESSGLSMQKIWEALMGRSHGYLVDEMTKLVQEISLSTGSKRVDLQIDFPCEEQRWAVHLLVGSDRDLCWQQFFAASLKWDKHFLGLVLVSYKVRVNGCKWKHGQTKGKHLVSNSKVTKWYPISRMLLYLRCHSYKAVAKMP